MGTPINRERSIAVSFSKLFSPLDLRHLRACKVVCPRIKGVIIGPQLTVTNGWCVYSHAIMRAGLDLTRLAGKSVTQESPVKIAP
jgi:hypothetical protein